MYHHTSAAPATVVRERTTTIVRSPKEWGAAEWIAIAVGAAVIAGIAGYLIHSASISDAAVTDAAAAGSGSGRGGRASSGRRR